VSNDVPTWNEGDEILGFGSKDDSAVKADVLGVQSELTITLFIPEFILQEVSREVCRAQALGTYETIIAPDSVCFALEDEQQILGHAVC
jgi:hypothetical protein